MPSLHHPIRQHLRRDPHQFIRGALTNPCVTIVRHNHQERNPQKIWPPDFKQSSHGKRLALRRWRCIVCPVGELWDCRPCRGPEYVEPMQGLVPFENTAPEVSRSTQRLRKVRDHLPPFARLKGDVPHQPWQSVRSNLPHRRDRLPGRPGRNVVQVKPLTQLFPVILRLPSTRPRHPDNHRQQHAPHRDQ